MSDKLEKINIETNKKEDQQEESQEQSLFSTIMKGTPNLLDLIDPVKISDKAFSTHKSKKFVSLSEQEKSKPKPNEMKIQSEANPKTNGELQDLSQKIEVEAPQYKDNQIEEEVPALPAIPLELPVPPTEIEVETKPEVQEESIFKYKPEQISTLYIKNLNEKINLTDLKYSLNFLFSQFGEVIAIQVSKKNKLRGQAFLTFAKPDEARKAMKSLQGTVFFQKQLTIQLAKTRALASFIHEGTFHNLSKRIHALRKSKVGIKTMLKDTEPAEAKHLMKTASHILSVQNFPEELTTERFKLLFRQFPGFKSARLLTQKKAGFVEFYDKAQAMMALKKYQGFMMDDKHLLKVRFAQQDDATLE
jgi:U1 small nuclear ribonucleoprotein A